MKKLLIALSLSLLSLSVFAHTEHTDQEKDQGYTYAYSCDESDLANLKNIYLYLRDSKFSAQADAIRNDSSICNIVAVAIDPSFDNGWVENDLFKSMIMDGTSLGVPFYIEFTRY